VAAAARAQVWAELDGSSWDLVIIGGGIVGAGVLREAVRLGLRTLLLEQRDFAWGTSSRSGQLVHGGLRYLAQAQVGLTWASVRERERLLRDAPGLVEPLAFLLPVYWGSHPGRLIYGFGLELYDRLGGLHAHRYLGREAFVLAAPHVSQDQLQGGYIFRDAQTDDARLVFRLIREAARHGGTALNYSRVEELLRDGDGRVAGVVVRDVAGTDGEGRGGSVARVHARAVVNATGAWADRLREQVGGRPRLRPLRGSHLIFPGWRLPLSAAVSFIHPNDGRPVYAFPWQGVTLVGTTDVDHGEDLDREAAISPREAAYLLRAVQAAFPRLHLTAGDVLASYAGVRPVVGTGKADPSKESREHVLWLEEGLLTVTGGKLTTFRAMALQVLQRLRALLPELPPADPQAPALDPLPEGPPSLPGWPGLDGAAAARRLAGRYGAAAAQLVAEAQEGELRPIAGTPYLWAEVRWAASHEAVVHLDDLLLRRVRLGLLVEDGAQPLLGRLRPLIQSGLGWDDARWAAEVERYQTLWQRAYAPPRLPAETQGQVEAQSRRA